jgi:hypothetical protein
MIASLLKVVAENFSRLAALLNSDDLFCRGPHYLLAQGLGLGFAYFTCHVLSLRTEEPLKVATFVMHAKKWERVG